MGPWRVFAVLLNDCLENGTFLFSLVPSFTCWGLPRWVLSLPWPDKGPSLPRDQAGASTRRRQHSRPFLEWWELELLTLLSSQDPPPAFSSRVGWKLALFDPFLTLQCKGLPLELYTWSLVSPTGRPWGSNVVWDRLALPEAERERTETVTGH